MNLSPIGYQPQVANQNLIGFKAKQLFRDIPYNTCSRNPQTGVGLIAAEKGKIKKIFPNTVNDGYVESLEQRIAAIKDKVHALTIRYDENNVFTGLGSNHLLLNCSLPIYTTDRFLHDDRDIISKNYSILTPQSMTILEKFINNEAFYENEVLRYHIIDHVIEDFVEKYNFFNGIKFKDDIDERANKINMVMDAYLDNPEAQQSEIMKETIGYIMARAGEASIDSVERALAVISNPNLYRNETVDELLYNMLPKSHFDNISNQEEGLRKRIEIASKKIDTIPRFRFYKACFKNNDYNINSINLPIVENFIEHPEFNKNDTWIENLPGLIYRINEYVTEYSERAAINRSTTFMDIMNSYLKSEKIKHDPNAARVYCDKFLMEW